VTHNPCHPHDVVADDGARLQGCAHGGHLTGWWPAGQPRSRLWMSSASTCGPGAAIRGGVPVVFPQFGVLGPLPKHGFARTVAWEPQHPSPTDEARLTFATTIPTRGDWPHQATLTLSASARAQMLTVRLAVANTASTPFAFTAALHTYLHVSSTADAGISGLEGRAAKDAAAGGRATTLGDERLSTVGPLDLMIRDVPGALVLHDAAQPDLVISTEGFRDWVVWNPGADHRLSDVQAGEEAGFVCIEPAVLEPVPIAPGQVWQASLIMTAR
jgi:glucose-6-phosphate 1-epimerase